MGYKKRYSNFNIPADMKAVNSTQALTDFYAGNVNERTNYADVQQKMATVTAPNSTDFKLDDIKVPVEKRSGGLDIEKMADTKKAEEEKIAEEKKQESTMPVRKAKGSNSLLYIGVIAIGIVGLMLLKNK